MLKRKLPRSLRKYIRKEKARIRQKTLSLKEREELIRLLYERLGIKINKKILPQTNTNHSKNDSKRNIQSSNKNGN